MFVFFDHEEVGRLARGAAGPFLSHVLDRLGRRAAGATTTSRVCDVDLRLGRHCAWGAPQLPRAPRARAPPDRERRPGDQDQRQPALRHDGDTAAAVRRACERRRGAVAVFVSRSDMPCGSTIGPLTAPGSASRRSTSASRSSRCTRPASSAATDDPPYPRRRPHRPTSSARRAVEALQRARRWASSNSSLQRRVQLGRDARARRARAAPGAVGPAARRDRRPDDHVHLARVDEASSPSASPAPSRRCRRARSAPRPSAPRRRRRRTAAARSGPTCARPRGTAPAARRPRARRCSAVSASRSAVPRRHREPTERREEPRRRPAASTASPCP